MMKSRVSAVLALAAWMAVALGGFVPAASAQPTVQPREHTGRPSAPPVVFEPTLLDLGIGKPGDKLHREAVIRNTGTTTIKITRLKGSCSCTVPSIDREVIPPGETATMTVVLDPGWMPIKQKKLVNVFVEGFTRPAVLNVHGEVAFAVRSERPVEKVSPNEPVAKFWVESTDGASFRVLRVNGKETDELGNPVSDTEAAARHDISYAFGEAEIPNFLVIETDHPQGAIAVVRMDNPAITRRDAEFRTSWRTERTFVNADKLQPGQSVEFLVPISGILENESPRLESTDDRITLEFLEKTETEGKRGWYDIHIRATVNDASAPGMINTPITIAAPEGPLSVRTFLVGTVADTGSTANE